ncbi:MAG TPA: preprotein translocase subunit SecG [Opitutaceae bacterium]|nr:preprotein translocase subunit SecG [Opitutaceae bacterium]
MITILINIFTVVLILVALFLGMIVLMQRAKSDAGMAAMGGGMMESTFGPDTSNVLGGLTIKATVVFFLLSFLLYLGYIYQRAHPVAGKSALPNISAPATLPAVPPASAPSASVPATPAPNAAPTTQPGGPAPKKP